MNLIIQRAIGIGLEDMTLLEGDADQRCVYGSIRRRHRTWIWMYQEEDIWTLRTLPLLNLLGLFDSGSGEAGRKEQSKEYLHSVEETFHLFGTYRISCTAIYKGIFRI